MGYSFFRADLDELGNVVNTLQQADQTMQDALSALKAEGAAKIGTADLDEACHDFQSKWKYGLDQIGQRVSTTVDGVKATRQAYQQAEEGVVQSLKAASSTGGGK